MTRETRNGTPVRFLGVALVSLLALVACGDDSAPPAAPHGPPGGFVDVDNGSIPLGEGGGGAAGRPVATGGGGGSSLGGAGSGQGGASNLPPPQGVSTPCETSDDCATGLSCHLSPEDYIAHRQCGKFCDTEEDCTTTLGKNSFCIGANVCVHACESDADCVEKTHCTSNGWCERKGPGSGNPYCGGLATPCSLLSDLECIGARGCTNNAKCSGSASSCYSQYTSYSCTSLSGCYWSSSSKSCSGSSRSCSSFSGELSCGYQDGCYWTGGCVGVPNSCATQFTSLCTTQPGCRLIVD